MQTVAEKSGNATQMTKLSHYYTAILEATVSVLLYRVYIYIYIHMHRTTTPATSLNIFYCEKHDNIVAWFIWFHGV
jgi:hypothetical protein